MVAALRVPVKKKQSKPRRIQGFAYSESDLVNLLRLFYFGEQGRWRSHLDKLDHQDSLQLLKGKQYGRKKRAPNPLAAKLTHAQVQWVANQLSEMSVNRAGRNIRGWYEYCLRILIGRTSAKHIDNATMPEVRDTDKAKALVAFREMLSHVIDRVGIPDVVEQKPDDKRDSVINRITELIKNRDNNLGLGAKSGKEKP